jgi:site-specific DNA-methyltransferase (adenine-specific)
VHRLAVAAEDIGFEIRDKVIWCYGTGVPKGLNLVEGEGRRTGRGTTLKPAHEPATLVRKPLDRVDRTVAATYATHGTSTLDIGGCRIGEQARWPSNVMLSEDVVDVVGVAPKFFFVAKPSRAERPRDGEIAHPTVKPLSLMRELVRLLAAPGQIVLDPFAGSGTTLEAAALEGVHSVGIEWESAYLGLIEQRLQRVGVAVGSTSARAMDGGEDTSAA